MGWTSFLSAHNQGRTRRSEVLFALGVGVRAASRRLEEKPDARKLANAALSPQALAQTSLHPTRLDNLFVGNPKLTNTVLFIYYLCDLLANF